MQLKKLLEKWDLTSLKFTAPFLEMEWEPKDEDKNAAWELYVELITRASTQRLLPEAGDEAAALASVHELFDLTRETIKHRGRYCINFTRIAVVVLNQKVRPFTAKWHRSVATGPLTETDRQAFRAELADLQTDLRNYTKLLADLDFATNYDVGLSDLLRAIEGHGGFGSKHATRRTPPEIPEAYCKWLKRRYADVDLLGQDTKRGHAVTLSQVYVPAVTQPKEATASDPELAAYPRAALRRHGGVDKQPTFLLERVAESSAFVAAPAGAGKSTFCRWATLQCLPGAAAAHPVAPPQGWEERIPKRLRRRLPFLVPLREFARCMNCGRGRRTSARGELERNLAAWLDSDPPDGLKGNLLRTHLAAGSAFLLFDGLDEIAVSELRDGTDVYPREFFLSGLADALPVWQEAGNRILLSSRPYGLDEGWLGRLALERAPLEPLPPPLQGLFVNRWFHTLGKEALADQLVHELREHPAIAPLVENPLLLTAICILYDNGGRLPEDRYELYKNIVSVVLHGRYSGDARLREPVLRRLEAIAYGMHTGEPDGPKAKNKGTPRPYLRNINVRWFDFDLSDLLEMPFEDAELDEFALRAGDVLICEGGEPGRAAVWENRSKGIYFQKAIHRVRFEPFVDPTFFVRALRSSADDGRLQGYFTGTGIKHLTGKGLAEYRFPLPPLAEQHRIVAKVDAMMALFDRLETALDTADTTRRRLLEALLHEALAPAAAPEMEAAE